MLGPLHGVPLAHKTCTVYRKGKVTTCGSKIRGDFRPDITATVIERLEGAGSITLGSLNMSEFAQGPTGHNQHFGHCRNPFDPAYCTGGSSSGSGRRGGAGGPASARSVPTPAARSACRPRCAASPASSRRRAASRAMARCRSPSPPTMSGRWRGPRAIAPAYMSVIAGHDPKDPTSSREPVPDYEAALDGSLQGQRIGVSHQLLLRRHRRGGAGRLRGRGRRPEGSRRDGSSGHDPPHGGDQHLWRHRLRCEGAAIHAQWLRRPGDYAIHLSSRLYPSLAIPAVHYIEAMARRGALLKALGRTSSTRSTASSRRRCAPGCRRSTPPTSTRGRPGDPALP